MNALQRIHINAASGASGTRAGDTGMLLWDGQGLITVFGAVDEVSQEPIFTT